MTSVDETQETTEGSKESRGKLTVKAIITRKDGTVEDLGVISEGPMEFEASGDPS